MTKGHVEVVPVNRIRVDEGIQTRKFMRPDVVQDYADEMNNGDTFPPLACFDTGKKLLLADGYHRLEAYIKNGVKEVAVEIRVGTAMDALIYAAGCNSSHGLRRSREDKINAVKMLLAKPEIASQSNRAIADMANVSDPFVGTVRAMANSTANDCSSETKRTGKDGKKRRVAKKKNKARQPGCEDPAKANPNDPKQGEPTFDVKAFNADVGTVARHFDRIARDYGLVHAKSHTIKESTEHLGLRRLLGEVQSGVSAWIAKLKKDKKDAGKAAAKNSS